MANWFVDSVQGVGGLGDGTSWANAYLTLAAAFTAKAAGDTFWVGDDHAETQASALTLTSPGTVANPCFVYCVDHTKASPGTGDLKTTATISTTGASAMTLAGTAYCYGVTFSCGNGANVAALTVANTTGGEWTIEAGSLQSGTTSSSTIILGGVARSIAYLRNTTIKVAAAGTTINSNGGFRWQNTAAAILGATLPTTLISPANSMTTAILEGVDLSALTSGKTIVGSIAGQAQIYLKDCAFGAGATVTTTPSAPGGNIYSIRSDSGATNYRNEKYAYTGTETTETSITRVGGATDGTTAQSRKIVTTANSKWVLPFEGLPLRIWNPFTGGSHSITLYGTWNNAAVPNNDDLWADLEYLGTSGNPLGVFATATKANNLASGTPLTADGSTWNGGGSGAGWSPFSLTISFTPTQAGYLYIYPKAAKASSTFYLDPAPVLQ